MYVQLVLVVVVAACSAQNAAVTFPVKIINVTNGVCPSEEQRAEIRRELNSEVLAALSTLGLTPNNSASSCSALPANRPSGYYWILPTSGPPAVQLYCDFNRQCGCDGPSTWTRVAFLNASDPDHNCPSNWGNFTMPVQACGMTKLNRYHTYYSCDSVFYSTSGMNYSRVCGRIIAYQQGYSGAFDSLTYGSSIDYDYVAGVSLTHGNVGSRQHIWTFAAAAGETDHFGSRYVCDCSNSDVWPHSTGFVGDDYFCDTGNHEDTYSNSFHTDDPLWDGAGCGSNSTCCEFNSPPWFCKTLPQPTTDDLEVRICNHYTPITLLELYVQ